MMTDLYLDSQCRSCTQPGGFPNHWTCQKQTWGGLQFIHEWPCDLVPVPKSISSEQWRPGRRQMIPWRSCPCPLCHPWQIRSRILPRLAHTRLYAAARSLLTNGHEVHQDGEALHCFPWSKDCGRGACGESNQKPLGVEVLAKGGCK